MEYIITTSSKADSNMLNKAREFSNKLSIPFIQRDDNSLEFLTRSFPNKAIFLVEKNCNKLILGEHEYFFHPGMAKLRIRRLKNGQNDQMIDAMNLVKGDTILDGTLGLASDAIVASYFLGEGCKIFGLEAIDVLSSIVAEGLKNYQTPEKEINDAMRRIEVFNINHKDYLINNPTKSFDIIYFDPMFENTIKKSSAMQSLKPFTFNEGLDEETINLAKKLAKKRVVIKERAFSKEFKRFGCHRVVGGKYSKIAYGIIEIN